MSSQLHEVLDFYFLLTLYLLCLGSSNKSFSLPYIPYMHCINLYSIWFIVAYDSCNWNSISCEHVIDMLLFNILKIGMNMYIWFLHKPTIVYHLQHIFKEGLTHSMCCMYLLQVLLQWFLATLWCYYPSICNFLKAFLKIQLPFFTTFLPTTN
jgi:hypothetical protein